MPDTAQVLLTGCSMMLTVYIVMWCEWSRNNPRRQRDASYVGYGGW